MKTAPVSARANRRRLQQMSFAALGGAGMLLTASALRAQVAYTDAGNTGLFSGSITPSITADTSAANGDTLTFNNANGNDSTQSDDLAAALNFNALVFNNSGALTLNQGAGTTITLASTSGGTAPTVNLNNPGSVNNNLNLVLANDTSFLGSGFAIFGGVFSGAGSLNQNGSGRLILVNAANTYAGGTNISGGTIALGTDFSNNQNNNALGSGAVNITNGGTLRLGGAGGSTVVTFTLPNAITLNGGTVFGVDGLQRLGGTLSIGAGGGTLQANYGGKDIVVDGQLTGSGTLTFARADNNGGIRLTNNTNTFSGTANVNGFTNLDAANALANAAVVTTNQNDGNNKLLFGPSVTAATFGSLAGSGDFSLSNGTAGVTLTVGGNNTSTAFSGYLAGSGGLVKNGTGTMSLTREFGGSQFTGNVVVNGGALDVARPGNSDGSASDLGQSVPGRTVTVNAGAALTGSSNNWFGGGSTPDANLPTVIVNSGTLSLSSYTTIGAVNLNNGSTMTQSTNFTDSSFQGFAFRGDVTGTGATPSTISTTGTAGYHLGPNTTFNVAAGSALNVTAPLINQSGDFNNNPGALTKTGSGTMLLTAASTYTGTTTVSGGTLTVDSAGSTTARLANTGSIVLNAGGTLLLANSVPATASIDRLNNNAGLTLSGGTLNLGGQSEGAAFSNGVGMLTLTATSTLDFGTPGTGNVIQLGSVATPTLGSTLRITDWEGTPGSFGGTDQLLFAGDPMDFSTKFSQGQVSFDGSPGYGVSDDMGGIYEVYGLTAVPEPGTWVMVAMGLGSLAYAGRRKARLAA